MVRKRVHDMWHGSSFADPADSLGAKRTILVFLRILECSPRAPVGCRPFVVDPDARPSLPRLRKYRARRSGPLRGLPCTRRQRTPLPLSPSSLCYQRRCDLEADPAPSDGGQSGGGQLAVESE